MNVLKKAAAGIFALCLSVSAVSICDGTKSSMKIDAAETVSMEWGAVEIGGGGFVSGIVTGQKEMYARTDVGGAYKYNYETEEWEQLLEFLDEEDRGLLSVDAIAVDPTDDDTIYLLCGCAYFSGARTVIFKSVDGGKTFTEHDVTKFIQVHGNGDGRHCGEAIAVDPDDPDIIYCGGDVAAGESALIWSQDGGETWQAVKGYNELGYFSNSIKWPTWTDHMVNAVGDGEYNTQNGVATIMIENGKVYVGTSITGEANIVVADVGSDEFETLSADLPTDIFPSRINQDADGNLLISYVAGLCFGNGSGGVYRYNIKDGSVDNISPVNNSIGACVSAPDDANTLIATTCAVWSSQNWDTGTAWGEWLYRSYDGGKTWEDIYPGKKGDWYWDEEKGEMVQETLFDNLSDGGFDWVHGKAIHWSGAIVLNPRNSGQALVTSGNGIFDWNGIWTNDPEAVFAAGGIEEVVALDMTSVPGGANYSAIGDYDGFIHTDVNVSGQQYQPNMGSTSAIAYCPQNPDVMVRYAENQNDIANGFYSLDGGLTWTKMNSSTGGKAAITQLEDGTYRFFQSGSSDGAVKYSDDFGETWNSCEGIPTVYGSKTTYMLVEPEKPNVVYAYATYYNSSWVYSKTEPDLSDACYKFCVSTDYGKTFTSADICMYDQCDSAGRIAYLGEDNIILGAGWYGLYNVTDGGKTVTKKDVFYCKTVGYGAPEKEGGLNTLYIYGKPAESDPEGIYRSTDGGDTWVCINSDKLYGGTGNGNFLVGDMNEFGTVYMSTVGCGIVYGRIGSEIQKPTLPDNGVWGDADGSGEVEIADAVKIMCYLTDPENNPIEPDKAACGDVYQNGDGLSVQDALSIQKYLAQIIKELPES